MFDPLLLDLLREGEPAGTVRLTSKRLTFGRAPSNCVVYSHSTVSWHHAMVWVEAGSVWIRDMGSRNGTFVDDRSLTRVEPLEPGALVRLGAVPAFRLPESLTVRRHRCLVVVDLDNDLAFPLHDRAFLVHPAGLAPLSHRDAARLTVDGHGAVSLVRGGRTTAVALEEPLDVDGRRLVVREMADDMVPTRLLDPPVTLPYRLCVTVDATGPRVVVEDLHGHGQHVVTSRRRATLLHALAERLVADRGLGLLPEDEGWLSDFDARVAVWGPQVDHQSRGPLHALVYRLRSELRDAGLDPSLVEKRRRAIRVRVTNTIIPPGTK